MNTYMVIVFDANPDHSVTKVVFDSSPEDALRRVLNAAPCMAVELEEVVDGKILMMRCNNETHIVHRMH